MTIRSYIAAAAACAMLACSDANDGETRCTRDAECPFEQCCVESVCVDPGPVGACDSPQSAHGTISIAPTVTAGVATAFVLTLTDAYGRPLSGATVGVSAQSACDGCNAVVTASAVTDAQGRMQGTFTSTIAEAKTLEALLEGTAVASAQLTVVPDVAVRVGLVDLPTSALVTDALTFVATRFDTYGNPDAPDVSGGAQIALTLALDPNAGGLGFDAAPQSTSHLEATLGDGRATFPPTHIALPARRLQLRLTAATTSYSVVTPPTFDVVGPSFSSSMPDTLGTGAQSITWSVEPAVEVEVTDVASQTVVTPASSPTALTSTVSPLLGNTGRVRVRGTAERAGYDVEVARVGAVSAFTGSGTLAGGNTIRLLRAFSNGDVLVMGDATGSVVLGGQTIMPASATTQQSYVARLDASLAVLRWVTFLYARSGSGGSDTVTTISDVTIDDDDGVAIVGTFNGEYGAWASTTLLCSLDGRSSASADLAYVHLNADGEIIKCFSGHDDSTTYDVVSPVVTTLGTSHYVAARVRSDLSFYPGQLAPYSLGDPPIYYASHGASASVHVSSDDATECPSKGVLLLLAFDAADTPQTQTAFVSQVAMTPTSLAPDRTTNGLILGGSLCSPSSTRIQQGSNNPRVKTSSNDAVILTVTLTGNNADALNLQWQSGCTGLDQSYAQRQLPDGSVIVFGFNSGTCSFMPETPSSGGLGYVARVSDGSLQWVRYFTKTQLAPRNLVVDADRILMTGVGVGSVQLADSPHAAVAPASDSTPVGIIAELDLDGGVRWSSPVIGAAFMAEPLPLTRGRLLVGTAGTQTELVVGALDVTPLTVTPLTGTNWQPIVFEMAPADFVVRDVE